MIGSCCSCRTRWTDQWESRSPPTASVIVGGLFPKSFSNITVHTLPGCKTTVRSITCEIPNFLQPYLTNRGVTWSHTVWKVLIVQKVACLPLWRASPQDGDRQMRPSYHIHTAPSLPGIPWNFQSNIFIIIACWKTLLKAQIPYLLPLLISVYKTFSHKCIYSIAFLNLSVHLNHSQSFHIYSLLLIQWVVSG